MFLDYRFYRAWQRGDRRAVLVARLLLGGTVFLVAVIGIWCGLAALWSAA